MVITDDTIREGMLLRVVAHDPSTETRLRSAAGLGDCEYVEVRIPHVYRHMDRWVFRGVPFGGRHCGQTHEYWLNPPSGAFHWEEW